MIKRVKSLPTLYKRTSSGRIQQWTIYWQENFYFTIAGQVDGALKHSKPTLCAGKSLGRSNETTPVEQARREAKAKWRIKTERGWGSKLKQVDKTATFLEPMLAPRYQDLKQPLVFPVFSQPKLDGIRCIATRDGLWSRTGKRHVCCPHIEAALEPLFRLQPLMILDGEFYNHEFRADFDEISSIVRKTKPTKDDLAKAAKLMQYHVFDCCGESIIGKNIGDMTFDMRFARLAELLPKNSKIILVETDAIPGQLVLDKYYESYLKAGYEGQMIRLLGPYEPKKRSKFLIKRKETIDEEFEVVDVIEGKGKRAGMMGRFIIRLPNGETQKTNARGTDEQYKEWFRNKRKYIGKRATVRFGNYTPKGKLRFPRLVRFRPAGE